MGIENIVGNVLVQNSSSVWVLENHKAFNYTEGVAAEKYLEYVFDHAQDLSSTSSELETYIRDWSSEYHLSVKRAQLFAGFEFDSSLKVLEVGCGCGAISRYLGETFNDVVSIEGSISRAKLASMRTRELDSVTIISAPFQEINFTRKFDIIFCIGVYEYSASFVEGEDPYDAVLSYFSEMLSPKGIVVIAIENQFGLKYFNSCREDHTGTLFEGIEGYHEFGCKVKTFGKHELTENLNKYFSVIDFYYPYPDYKVPDCILSDEFLCSGRAGELVSQVFSRDYHGEKKKSWDESLVSMELSKNKMLSFFSNSFLVFAGKNKMAGVLFDQLAIMVNSQRNKEFRTLTKISTDQNSAIIANKTAFTKQSATTVGKLSLIESSSVWKEEISLQTQIYNNCKSKSMTLEEIFRPCKTWVDYLSSVADNSSGTNYLAGEYIDCIWSNVYRDSNGLSVIDKEWVWQEDIRLNVVVIRSIYIFLFRIKEADKFSAQLRIRSLRKLIVQIANTFGVTISDEDFSDFVIIESEFQSLIAGTDRKREKLVVRWLLLDKPSFYLADRTKKMISVFNRRIRYLVDLVKWKIFN